jgi:hypothetical protein
MVSYLTHKLSHSHTHSHSHHLCAEEQEVSQAVKIGDVHMRTLRMQCVSHEHAHA